MLGGETIRRCGEEEEAAKEAKEEDGIKKELGESSGLEAK